MSRNIPKPKASRKRTDREKVELFLKLANEMRQMAEEMGNTDPACKGFTYNCKFSRVDGVFRIMFTQPTENELRSFLMDVRKLRLQNGDASISAIHKIFYRRVQRDDMRRDIGEAYSDWRKQITVGNLTIDGRDLRPEYVLDVWDNGKYFHDDLDYAEEMERLKVSPVGSTLHRLQFLNAITTIANYAFWLANNITYSLKEGLLELDGPSSQRIDVSRKQH